MKIQLKIAVIGLLFYIVGSLFAPDMSNTTVLERVGIITLVVSMGIMGFAAGAYSGERIATETAPAH